MIDAMIGGRLYAKAQTRTSRNGNQFVTAKMRAMMSNGEAAYVDVVAFNDETQRGLLALDAGDAVALAGDLKIGTYTSKNGEARASLHLTAWVVMSNYQIARKRRTTNGEP